LKKIAIRPDLQWLRKRHAETSSAEPNGDDIERQVELHALELAILAMSTPEGATALERELLDADAKGGINAVLERVVAELKNAHREGKT
jgi:hypothetical protein